MKVIQKINNNAVVCADSKGNELVAFGKGLGFPKVPYEITDLNKIELTFYRINVHNFQLLKEIPEDIFEVSAKIATIAQKHFSYRLNPNIIFSLADHINFSIIRLREYKETKMPFSYDIKQLYPNEYKVGVMAVETVCRDLNIKLPDNESLALAMHFVNAQETTSITVTDSLFEKITATVVNIIKDYFKIIIDQNDFSYNRFLMHLRYYLKRIEMNEQVSNENNHVLMQAIKAESPDIYHCTIQIVNAIDDKLRTISTDDEVFYLMIYVKRIVTKSLKREEIKNG